jgi:hypothetical protein
VLLLGCLLAWTCALGLAANDKSAAVATTFAMSGFLLLCAAAFFERVREIRAGNMAIALVNKFMSETERVQVPAALSGEAERYRLISGLETALTEGVDVGVAAYAQGAQIERQVAEALREKGFEHLQQPHGVGVDLVFSRPSDQTVAAVEIQPRLHDGRRISPGTLQPSFLSARTWADRVLGGSPSFERLVATAGDPSQPVLDSFQEHGIGILRVDPDSGTVEQLLAPDDSGKAD